MTASRFVKRDSSAPPGFFAAEARGLARLRESKGAPVVDVIEHDATHISLRRLEHTAPTPAQAHDFGAALATTHQYGTSEYGARDGDGFIGPLVLPNGPFDDWPALYWEGRCEPYLRLAVDAGTLAGGEATTIERAVTAGVESVLVDPRPSLLHGDLWSGNVVWTPDGCVLIDGAAAHGGHRETDLAMLALFGAPHLTEIMAGYESAWPLLDGWRNRQPLHQIHPLLVHVALFGGGYAAQTLAAANRTLAAFG